jgi:sulfite reductase (NADPH) flavoprotein alpha-component
MRAPIRVSSCPLLLAHRWLALALTPVFLLILLSGAILAVKPMVASEQAAAPTDRIPTDTLVAALEAIDPAGRAAAVGFAGDGRWTDAGEITRARRFRDGSALVKTASPEGERFHVVESGGRVALTGTSGWVKALHEGAWAGPWSGALNLISAVALIALVGTGLLSWWRGLRRAPRPVRADQDTARLLRGRTPTARSAAGSAAHLVGRVRP